MANIKKTAPAPAATAPVVTPQSQKSEIKLPVRPEGQAGQDYDDLLEACRKHVEDGRKFAAPLPENFEERVVIATMIAYFREMGSITKEQAQKLIDASNGKDYELAISDRTKVEVTHCTEVKEEKNPGQWGVREFQRLKVSFEGKNYRVYHAGFKPGTPGAEKFAGLTFKAVENKCMVDGQLVEKLLKGGDGKWRIVATLTIFGLMTGDGVEWIELKAVEVVEQPAASNSMLVSE